jgi:hypothetical protein
MRAADEAQNIRERRSSNLTIPHASEPANRKELVTVAVGREKGQILWHQVVQAEAQAGFHPLNNPASSTPGVVENKIFVRTAGHLYAVGE